MKATQRFNDADKRNVDALRRIATNIAGKWEISIWEDWQTPRLYWLKMHTGAGSIRGLVESFPRHRSDYDKRSQRKIAFTIGVIAVGAKMAKADGIVTRDSPLILDQGPELLSLSEPF